MGVHTRVAARCRFVVDREETAMPVPSEGNPGPKSFSEKLDESLRLADLHARRTVGGWMDVQLGIRGHSPAAVLLPAALCALLVLGSPTTFRSVVAVGAGLVVGLLVVLQLRSATRSKKTITFDFGAQVLLMLLLCSAIWIWGGDTYKEDWPYTHVFIPLAIVAAAALVTGRLALGQLGKGLTDPNGYPEYLKRTELFASREAVPEWSLGSLLAAVSTPVRSPLMLLTLPAIATLLSPPAWIPLIPWTVFGVCAAALLLSGVNERFGFMWALLQENLFRGGGLVISLAAIALAAGRLVGSTYVTTIFDSAAWWTITVLFATAYVLAWWFDYWCYRLLTERIIRLIGPGVPDREAVPYDLNPEIKATSVPPQGRFVQAHGSGRILAIQGEGKKLRFQAWSALDAVQLLASSGAPGGKAKPGPGLVSLRATSYLSLAMGSFVLIVYLSGLYLHKGRQAAELAVNAMAEPTLDLRELLLSKSKDAAVNEPLIVVAASGGGTRAAVYTASVMEAIARAGKGERVAFVSGVSGGGAALAYFAGHEDELVKNRTDAAWDAYFDVMTKPFIRDVLVRSTQWSVVGQDRLGMLLRDSFQQRWNMPNGAMKMGQINQLGLMLNTSLAGEFVSPEGEGCTRPLIETEQEHRKDTSSSLAGGRLVLTNLKFPVAIQQDPLEPDVGDPKLPVMIQSTGVRLEDAAALNANFPPVFSDAAIDDGCWKRYWVTDGGAVDNRGMEMMLLALEKTLSFMKEKGDTLPPLHFVIADASALSVEFEQDRGVSSLSGAGAHFASHLDAALYSEIQELYGSEAASKLTMSYVTMPDILRESGSFGTHWMLQETIRVRHRLNPMPGSAAASGVMAGQASAALVASSGASSKEPEYESVRVPGDEIVKVLRALEASPAKKLTTDACSVRTWAWDDIEKQPGWRSFQKAVGVTAPTGTCS